MDCNVVATIERIYANCCYAVGNCYTCKAFTIFERLCTDCVNAIGECYTCKACAIRERTIANCGYAIVNYYTFKACAMTERTKTNCNYAVGNFYTCKACATSERIITNTCHAIRNFYTCKPCAITERPHTNCFYGISFNCIGNYHRSSVFIATCYSNHPIADAVCKVTISSKKPGILIKRRSFKRIFTCIHRSRHGKRSRCQNHGKKKADKQYFSHNSASKSKYYDIFYHTHPFLSTFRSSATSPSFSNN